jgi:predicted ATPase/DNA-binding winged helix-turn-helix (wHTH) protein
MTERALRFGRFRLDLARRQLHLDERLLRLGDRALQVLCVLAGAKGALVSKDELMARVWAGQIVEENNLQVQISTLRKTLDREGTGENWIVTVPGRGYRLLGVGNAGSHADSPPAKPAPALHSNLPQLTNPLIGREHDVAEIEALLSRHRLVTLVGAPGVGKTSLSLQAGENLWAGFRDGARFVELTPLDRDELVGEAVAAAFGLPVQGQMPATEAITALLRSRRVLLILDNCEHVIAAVARLADVILKMCPGVVLLATSREALSVPGEHAYPVPLLDVPPRTTSLTAVQAMEHSAVQLFVERAAAALGRFSLTDETAPIAAEICRRLDGIPLAIELTAPRLKVLAPVALLARLDDRLRLLTAGTRTAVPRQQTLHAALEWSYGLLSEAEQVTLQRFGVFAGSFTMAAVEAVATGTPVEGRLRCARQACGQVAGGAARGGGREPLPIAGVNAGVCAGEAGHQPLHRAGAPVMRAHDDRVRACRANLAYDPPGRLAGRVSTGIGQSANGSWVVAGPVRRPGFRAEARGLYLLAVARTVFGTRATTLV